MWFGRRRLPSMNHLGLPPSAVSLHRSLQLYRVNKLASGTLPMRGYLTEQITSTRVVADHEAHERQQRGTRQLFLARVFFFASAYVVAAILARNLGPADYGVYGVVISQLLWLEIVVSAGVPAAAAKLIADGRYDVGEVERSARTLLLGVSVLLFAICWYISPSLARLMQI